jgi:hypothetical protein
MGKGSDSDYDKWKVSVVICDNRSLEIFKICPYKTALYYWICQMLYETSFQIINIYSISSQNRASELVLYWLLKGCESDVDSEELLTNMMSIEKTRAF